MHCCSEYSDITKLFNLLHLSLLPVRIPPASPLCAGASVYLGVCLCFVFCVCALHSSGVYVQRECVCGVINSVFCEGHLGADWNPNPSWHERQHDRNTCCSTWRGSVWHLPWLLLSVRTHTSTHSFTHTHLDTPVEPMRVSSNTVTNIYTLLHQSRQANELLTGECTHKHTSHTALHPFPARRTWPESLSQLRAVCFNKCVCLSVCVCICLPACLPVCVRLRVLACMHVLGSLCVHKSLLEV